jgi:hypothetical protein
MSAKFIKGKVKQNRNYFKTVQRSHSAMFSDRLYTYQTRLLYKSCPTDL